MNISNKTGILLAGLGLLVGTAGTLAYQTRAQTSTVTAAADTTTSSAATGTADAQPRGHAPLGGDGNITAINGNTITMQEEADEGGASYTVDASNASVSNNGAAGSLADLKIGDKIFVSGPVTGNNVAATSISLGHGPMGGR